MNDITRRLEHEKIGTLLLYYTIPAIIGTMVNALYNIVDRIFIGHGVGALAISGLTLTFPILIFLQAFGMLIGVGSAARVSIFLGRKDYSKAEKVLGNACILTFLFTGSTSLLSLLFMEDLLWLFGGNEEIIPYALDYLYITIPGTIFATFSFSFNNIMRASGYPGKAMVTMLIGAFLNVILDAVFIFYFDMGIRGAAIATVISMFVSAIYVMSHFFNKKSLIRFRKPSFQLEFSIVLSILSIGISPFAMQLAASLVNVVLNASLSKYGMLAIGANGIISSIGILLVMLIMGIAQGMQPIIGYNYGASRHDRVKETLKYSIIVATIITGIGWGCSQLFPGWIVKGFTNSPELIDISANGLRLTLFLMLIVGSQIIISQYFLSIGSAWKAILLSLSRQCVFLIPMILILPRYFGLDGIWLASPLSDFMAGTLAWLLLWEHVKSIKNRTFELN